MAETYVLEPSPKSAKKWRITTPWGKSVDFGATGYSDYTLHKDPNRQRNYLSRHATRENWTKSGTDTAGFWSRWLLWNLPDLMESVKDTEARFNITIDVSAIGQNPSTVPSSPRSLNNQSISLPPAPLSPPLSPSNLSLSSVTIPLSSSQSSQILPFNSLSDSMQTNTKSNYTVPNYTVPNYTVPNYTVPNYTVPNYTVPNYTVPTNTKSNYTVPNYTTPNYTVPMSSLAPLSSFANFALPAVTTNSILPNNLPPLTTNNLPSLTTNNLPPLTTNNLPPLTTNNLTPMSSLLPVPRLPISSPRSSPRSYQTLPSNVPLLPSYNTSNYSAVSLPTVSMSPMANIQLSVSPTYHNNFRDTSMMNEYQQCKTEAADRKSQGKLKLCPEGYCTAKLTEEVYPSYWANLKASKICTGQLEDYEGKTQNYYEMYNNKK
jgi:hypothetical protein